MKKGRDSLNSEKVLDLVAGAQSGDSEALSQLVMLVTPTVHWQAKRLALKGVELEDLCQEGMFAVLSAISSYKPDAGASFETFVNLCVRRRLLSVVQRSSGEINADFELSDSEAALLPELSAEEQTIQADSLQQLLSYIDSTLSEKEHKTLELFLSGFSYQETAEKLQTTPKAVESTLGRVRKKLSLYKK